MYIGYLIHWEHNESFSSVFKKYVNYVLQHHGESAVVVFDGYSSEGNPRSTTSAEGALVQDCATQLKFY